MRIQSHSAIKPFGYNLYHPVRAFLLHAAPQIYRLSEVKRTQPTNKWAVNILDWKLLIFTFAFNPIFDAAFFACFVLLTVNGGCCVVLVNPEFCIEQICLYLKQ